MIHLENQPVGGWGIVVLIDTWTNVYLLCEVRDCRCVVWVQTCGGKFCAEWKRATVKRLTGHSKACQVLRSKSSMCGVKLSWLSTHM